jgi:zinc protease
MRFLTLCGATLVLMLGGLAPAAANPSEKILANGLKVIVKEDRRAPTVAHMVWYRAGSMDEVDGTSGVAHLLEHMMFKGTPEVGAGEFSKRVAAAGGRDNAFTSRDYTAYFQQVPKESLEAMMRLEADRMRHLTLAAAEFDQEIKVVMEERRLRTDDEPGSQLMEQLNAVAFTAHSYRRPVIGFMDDLEHMTVQDARDWYDRWYVPNNATVVVVGDVSAKDVFALAEKYYGPLAARPLPVRKPRAEPLQTGERRLVVKAPAELPQLVMAYKVPGLRDPQKDREPYALEMLAAILDGYEGARFPRRLVKEQGLAVSAGAGYDGTGRGPATFTLSASPREGKTVAELEAALRAEIARVQKDGVSAEELARAKAQLVAGETYKLDSMFGQAMEMGQLETIGLSYKDDKVMLERLRAVTAEEVQAVARKAFSDDLLTVAVLDPQPLPDTPRKPAAAGGHRH